MSIFQPSRRLLLLAALPDLAASAALHTQQSKITQNTTAVGYTSDPGGRGTPSLVISCLLTLVLCVWSALHLNVPRQGRSNRQTLFLNIQWITAGIYAPELVVFTAWRQWSSARLLSRSIVNSNMSNKAPVLTHPWTLTHSFFASTGGFAIDCTAFHGTLLPKDGPKRLTVTARGMKFLAEHGVIPNVPEEDIEDKSKADAMAKSLVLLQALWMLLQVIGRLVARLPVTLLEVNTVAHVLCALSMYIMWWKKPLLAKEPIMISSPLLAGLFPYMFMKSTVSGRIDKAQIHSQTIIKTLLASLKLYTKVPEIEYFCFRPQSISETERNGNSSTVDQQSWSLEGSGLQLRHYPIDPGCRAFKTKDALSKDSSIAFFERKPRVRAETSKYFEVDRTIMDRAEAFAEALNRGELASAPKESHKVGEGTDCWHIEAEELLSKRSRNWPNDELLRSVDGLVVGIVLWLANFIYGGIHLAAWNDHFPSTLEKWMWRASALYIAFCGGLWVMLNLVVRQYRHLNDFWERWMDGEKGWVQNISLGAIVFICGFSLVIARAYIVIEAFVSIRRLPSAAYETPEWSQIFPHF